MASATFPPDVHASHVFPVTTSSFARAPRWRAWTRRGRLRHYADAMGWRVAVDGSLVGELDSAPVCARVMDRDLVIEVEARGLLPVFELGPRPLASGGGRGIEATGDARFDRDFVLRAEHPWLVRAMLGHDVRRALLAAPPQRITTSGSRLTSVSVADLEPLGVFARTTVLRAMLNAVPWEAYADLWSLPAQDDVQQIVRDRAMRPLEVLPSVPRRD